MENLQYDLMRIAMYKAESVWKLEKHYLEDASDDEEVAALFEEIIKSDADQLERLKALMANRVAK